MLIISLSLAVTVLSFFFTLYYRSTRKSGTPAGIPERDRGKKLLLCAGLNAVILILSGPPASKGSLLFFLLLTALADIDILIRKIPTELLAFVCVYSVSRLFPFGLRSLPLFLSPLAAGAALFLTRPKTRIGIYDILLVLFLSLCMESVSGQLKFFALFLILWGLIGLAGALNKKRGELIPLAPVIIIAWSILVRTGLP